MTSKLYAMFALKIKIYVMMLLTIPFVQYRSSNNGMWLYKTILKNNYTDRLNSLRGLTKLMKDGRIYNQIKSNNFNTWINY